MPRYHQSPELNIPRILTDFPSSHPNVLWSAFSDAAAVHVGKLLNVFGDTARHDAKRLENASIDLQRNVMVQCKVEEHGLNWVGERAT